jgi:membrane protein
LYFTYASTASAYGAAGTFVVVLLWVYYSCWILFYGAELIQVHARMRGKRIAPDEDARKVPRSAQKWQGGNFHPES